MDRVGVSVTWKYCDDLKVMGLDPGQVELGMCNKSVEVAFE